MSDMSFFLRFEPERRYRFEDRAVRPATDPGIPASRDMTAGAHFEKMRELCGKTATRKETCV